MEVDYENPWIYEGSPLPLMILGTTMGSSIASQIPPAGKSYIGRKYFVQKRKPRGAKEESQVNQTGRRYYGSSEDLKRGY